MKISQRYDSRYNVRQMTEGKVEQNALSMIGSLVYWVEYLMSANRSMLIKLREQGIFI